MRRLLVALALGALCPGTLRRTASALATYELTCGTYCGHAGSVLGARSIALVSDQSADGVVVALNVTSELDAQLPSVADALVCMSI